jgi:hypothetical protein
LYSAGLFLSFGQAKWWVGITNDRPATLWQLTQAGCITGFFASFIEGPIDVIKSKMQGTCFYPFVENKEAFPLL